MDPKIKPSGGQSSCVCQVPALLSASVFLLGLVGDAQNITAGSRHDKALSVFNVVSSFISLLDTLTIYVSPCWGIMVAMVMDLVV